MASVISGGYGSGKTAALVDRWQELASTHGSARVLFVAARPAAAADVRLRMVASAATQGTTAGPLAVTTWTGVALDLVRRHGEGLADVSVVAGATRARLIANLFGGERGRVDELWAASAFVASRRAFPAQLASAVSAYLSSGLTPDEIASVADTHEVGERWAELAAFVDRYRAYLRSVDAIDAAEAMALAVALAARADVRAAFAERFDALLVDDAETLTPRAAVLLDALARAGLDVAVAANPEGWRGHSVVDPVDSVEQFAATHGATVAALGEPADAARRLAFCRHPSIEADAIVGELVAAHDDGVAWHEMAVVVPREGLPVARGVVRALRRAEVPVRVPFASGDAEPVVRRLRELLAADDHDVALIGAVARAVDTVMGELAPAGVDLVAPDPSLDRALDALVAFNAMGLRWIDEQPRGGATVGAFLHAITDPDGPLDIDPDRGGSDGVAVVSPATAAGRHWRAVVVTSCVEGEYPRVGASVGWFDDAITTPVGPMELAERRRVAVTEQRRRFELVASRGEQVTFVTAPQPGVLVSRYVQHLVPDDARPAWPAAAKPDRLPATVSTTPMHPSGSLRLSASQLSSFEDCPRRWYYGSVLRLDDSSSVWTEFGTLVHNVLEVFLAPDATVEYSLESLLELSEQMWTDTVAHWAPQREQARRELREILERWWEIEGATFSRDRVVAVEHEFEVAVGDHVVRGRIDRVDYDQLGGGVAVIDYKTGRPPRRSRDAEPEYDLQMAVYYLAALRSEVLERVGPPTLLRLMYFRHKTNPFFDEQISANHEDVAITRINAAAEQMLEERLDPNPEAECRYCDFHRLCSLQKAGREVGAS